MGLYRCFTSREGSQLFHIWWGVSVAVLSHVISPHLTASLPIRFLALLIWAHRTKAAATVTITGPITQRLLLRLQLLLPSLLAPCPINRKKFLFFLDAKFFPPFVRLRITVMMPHRSETQSVVYLIYGGYFL